MERIQVARVTDAVTQRVLGWVSEGRYGQGDKLPTEAKLTQMLGVSRGSLREAMKQLQLMGIVDIRQGDGTYLREVGFNSIPLTKLLGNLLTFAQSEFLDLMDIRKLVECEAVGLCVKNASKEEISELGVLLKKMDTEFSDRTEFLQDDIIFHHKIAVISHNAVLPIVLVPICDLLLGQRDVLVELPDVPSRGHDYHLKIFKALEARSATQAIEMMREHLEDITKAIVSYFADKTSSTRLVKKPLTSEL